MRGYGRGVREEHRLSLVELEAEGAEPRPERVHGSKPRHAIGREDRHVVDPTEMLHTDTAHGRIDVRKHRVGKHGRGHWTDRKPLDTVRGEDPQPRYDLLGGRRRRAHLLQSGGHGRHGDRGVARPNVRDGHPARAQRQPARLPEPSSPGRPPGLQDRVPSLGCQPSTRFACDSPPSAFRTNGTARATARAKRISSAASSRASLRAPSPGLGESSQRMGRRSAGPDGVGLRDIVSAR